MPVAIATITTIMQPPQVCHGWLAQQCVAGTRLPLLAALSFTWLNAALATALVLLAAYAFRRLRGTTLAAPAAWAAAAAATIAAVETFLALRPQLENELPGSLLRYAAAVGTFTPLMAVLGAKRPQDRGWQWVVLSLWVVLLVPAGQAWASRTGAAFHLPLAWRLMLYALIALGLLNYLPTTNALPALLTSIAQACLFASHVVEAPPGTPDAHITLGLTLMTLAALIPTARSLPAPPASGSPRRVARGDLQLASASRPWRPPAYSLRWLAFRNAWGAFWALRIMQRINETANLGNWPVRLEWHGFTPLQDGAAAEVDEPTAVHIQQTLDSLLRRFVRTPDA